MRLDIDIEPVAAQGRLQLYGFEQHGVRARKHRERLRRWLFGVEIGPNSFEVACGVRILLFGALEKSQKALRRLSRLELEKQADNRRGFRLDIGKAIE